MLTRDVLTRVFTRVGVKKEALTRVVFTRVRVNKGGLNKVGVYMGGC